MQIGTLQKGDFHHVQVSYLTEITIRARVAPGPMLMGKNNDEGGAGMRKISRLPGRNKTRTRSACMRQPYVLCAALISLITTRIHAAIPREGEPPVAPVA